MMILGNALVLGGMNASLLGPPPDADVTAYVSALQAKGVSPSVNQVAAIDAFIRGEKLAGRWDTIKRLYLPIWNNAAASAIDLKTRTSGTWGTGVTHAPSYVQGNATSGYFDTGVTMANTGIGPYSASLISLVVSPDSLSGSDVNRINGTTFENDAELSRIYMAIARPNNAVLANGPLLSVSTVSASNMNRGAMVYSLGPAGQRNHLTVRKSGGLSVAETGIVPTGVLWTIDRPINFMAARTASGRNFYNDARYAAWGVGLSLTKSDADAFTLALGNLYTSLTGNQLPA